MHVTWVCLCGKITSCSGSQSCTNTPLIQNSVCVFDFRRYYHQESSSDQYSDSDQSFTQGDQSRVVPGREVDGASASSSPTTSAVYSPQTNVTTTPMLVPSTATVAGKSTEQVTCKSAELFLCVGGSTLMHINIGIPKNH